MYKYKNILESTMPTPNKKTTKQKNIPSLSVSLASGLGASLSFDTKSRKTW